jgi:hypothetical protein
VPLDDRLGNAQSEARSRGSRISAVEAVEELLSCILRNTWSVVRDLELHAVGGVTSADGDAGAGRGVIVRVGHKVDQRLLQPALVSYHQERAVHGNFKDLPFLLGQRMGHRNRAHDCGTEIKRCGREREPPSLELIEGEQVVDLEPKPIDVAAGVAQELRLIVTQPGSCAGLKQAESGSNGGQWCL